MKYNPPATQTLLPTHLIPPPPSPLYPESEPECTSCTGGSHKQEGTRARPTSSAGVKAPKPQSPQTPKAPQPPTPKSPKSPKAPNPKANEPASPPVQAWHRVWYGVEVKAAQRGELLLQRCGSHGVHLIRSLPRDLNGQAAVEVVPDNLQGGTVQRQGAGMVL